MDHVTDVQPTESPDKAVRDAIPALPIDEARLAMMQRVKRLSIAERIALLDRLCREGTQIATRARRIK